MAIKTQSGLAIALALSLTACGGGGGSSTTTTPTATSTSSSTPLSSTSSSTSSSSTSKSTTSSSSSSSKSPASITLSGVVTDEPIANATVTFYVGSQTFVTTADGSGKYTLLLSANAEDFNKPIKVVARGNANQADVELVSMLPSFTRLRAQAGDDATLTSIENLAVNITNLTTAEFALIQRNHLNTDSDEALISAQASINESDKLNLAALIKVIVDSPDHQLPSDIHTTLELATNPVQANNYLTALGEETLQASIRNILNDKELTPANALVGSWVSDDANLQYPNKSIVVITFINNTDFLAVRIGKQPDDANCTSGVELGTYEWTKATNTLTFRAKKDENGDCGVTKSGGEQSFAASVSDNEITLGQKALKKVQGDYPLAGAWAYVDNETQLNIVNFISSTTAVSASEGTYSYWTYTYNATTGQLATHALVNYHEQDSYTGTITQHNATQFTVEDAASSPEVWKALAHLDYQYPDSLISNPIVGSWYFSDTADAYPQQTHVVLSFSENGSYLLTIDARADDTKCHDGIERGTYTWNSLTSVINTQPKERTIGTQCGTTDGLQLKADGLKLTVTEKGPNDEHFVTEYTRLIGWNPIIGGWVRINHESELNALYLLSDNSHYMTVSGTAVEFGRFQEQGTAENKTLTFTSMSNSNAPFTTQYAQPDTHHLNMLDASNTPIYEWIELSSWSSPVGNIEGGDDNNEGSDNPIVAANTSNSQGALLSPNGGESWNSGQQRTITWQTSAISGSTVNIYVLHDDPATLLGTPNLVTAAAINTRTWYKFASEVPNSGSYTLDPAALNGSGNAYMILVVSSANAGQYDLSDTTFSLAP